MKNNTTIEVHNFYSTNSYFTDPGDNNVLLEDLPTDVSELVKIIQGLILHVNMTELYGISLSEVRKQEANLRFVSKQLKQIKRLDSSPITITRPFERRLLGSCRDYSVMLCALLRHRGIAARPRCGFATYFKPGLYEDHWICEYWKSNEQRWAMIDAQLDELQKNKFLINFDPLDMPEEKFITGGRAWQMCRKEKIDPEKFGVFNMHGLWFIRGNLVRDVASLNKMELLPWDCWALSTGEDEDLTDNDFALLDLVAPLTLPEYFSFSNLQKIYTINKGLCVPSVIQSFIGGKFEEVDLTQ